MASVRETILQALEAALVAGAAPVEVRRNEVVDFAIPDGGLIILRDGEPGEPDHTFSPLRYHYAHRAVAEVYLSGAGAEAAFDAILTDIGAALAADRTLGGLCDWVEPEAPVPDDTPVDGAAPFRAAAVGIRLHYATPDPLS